MKPIEKLLVFRSAGVSKTKCMALFFLHSRLQIQCTCLDFINCQVIQKRLCQFQHLLFGDQLFPGDIMTMIMKNCIINRWVYDGYDVNMCIMMMIKGMCNFFALDDDDECLENNEDKHELTQEEGLIWRGCQVGWSNPDFLELAFLLLQKLIWNRWAAKIKLWNKRWKWQQYH